MTWTVEQGDCLEVLRGLPDASIDSIVTDPPAGISFMGKGWDDDKGGPEEWISWLSSVMRECLRVLKPGGHALVWAIPRTSHWTGMACELAGFEVRDRVTHLFGSGFPKSLNVSKAIDDAAGATRPTVRANPNHRAVSGVNYDGVYAGGNTGAATITAPATPEAEQWDGWGTALKPAAEDWWLLRKPLAGTVARNVLEHGTGALNVDGCRVATDWSERPESWKRSGHSAKPDADKIAAPPGQGINCHELGRWPSNVVLSHHEECTYDPDYGECSPNCPVAMLDAQSGISKSTGGSRGAGGQNGRYNAIGAQDIKPGIGDSGGASRFFYTAKTSTKEREAGLEGLPKRGAAELTDREPDTDGLKSPRAGAGRTSKGRANHHPTVKPLALMRWLVRLITPPGGIVLDPFTGSGSTGCAAVQEGFVFCGIEQDADYVEIARARIAHWEGKAA